jgi:predicted transcriptional regulator
MDQDAYDTLLQRLTALVVKLDSTYDALLEANQHQQEFNRQQVELNARQADINANVRTTLARVETLLRRMLRTEDNGRDA